jgi:hypothetical protein
MTLIQSHITIQLCSRLKFCQGWYNLKGGNCNIFLVNVEINANKGTKSCSFLLYITVKSI